MLSQWSKILENPSGQYQQVFSRKAKKSLDYFSSMKYPFPFIENNFHCPPLDTFLVIGVDSMDGIP